MYLSIRDEVLFAAGYSTPLEGLADLNLTGIELWLDRENSVPSLTSAAGKPRLILTNSADLTVLKRQIRENGVQVSALCMGNNFNAADRAKEIAWAVGAVQIAETLEVPAIRIDAIMQGEKDLPLEARQEIVAGAVREILAATAASSVELGIENHGFQGNDPLFLKGLLEKAGSPRLGLTLDSGNFYWRGWPLLKVYEIFAQFAPVVKHTHLKNICYPEPMRETEREMGYRYGEFACPVHLGDIDHTRYFALLREAGYSRDLCLEDESFGRFSEEERKANLRAAADSFRSHIAS